MDRGAWWATVHGVSKELDTTELLNSNKETGSLGHVDVLAMAVGGAVLGRILMSGCTRPWCDWLSMPAIDLGYWPWGAAPAGTEIAEKVECQAWELSPKEWENYFVCFVTVIMHIHCSQALIV